MDLPESEARVSLSPSVEAVVRDLGEEATVDAAKIVRRLLERHPEYARDGGGRLASRLLPTSRKQRTIEWINSVRGLLAQDVTVLHGRLLILGLAHLEMDLEEQLREAGFIDLLQEELREPVDAVIPEAAAPPERVPVDSARFLADNPAFEDQLYRRPFAGYLAAKLRYLRAEEEGSFLIHLDGPWGVGKTSLLNLLRAELERKLPKRRGPPPGNSEMERRRWVVATFNAWQNQRLDPPWWAFLRTLSLQGARGLWRTGRPLRAIWFWLLEGGWRMWMALASVLIAGVVLAAIIWFVFGELDFAFLGVSSDSLRDVGLLTTLAGTAYLVAQRVLPTSHRAVQAFIQSSRDPMKAVAAHFASLAKRAYPLAVFIDDLDRCREEYVVQLLEGIQTLFRDAQVAYVVASDRRWIEASYEVVYERLAKSVGEPGRPLGYLFLHKAFQVSAGVPPMNDSVATGYWTGLLERSDHPTTASSEQALADARERFAVSRSPEDVEQALAGFTGDPAEYGVLAQAGLERLAAPEMRLKTEHALLSLEPLLERNPRAMKRLVNAYDVQRALLIQRGPTQVYVPDLPKKLGLWTIVLGRWPSLAQWLQTNPESLDWILGLSDDPKLLPGDPELKALFSDREVKRVVQGDQVEVSLTVDTIRVLAGLQRADQQRPVVA
jgi:hypothetical protein